MTIKELRLEYLKDTGKYTPMIEDPEIPVTSSYSEYIEWLEQKIIEMQQPIFKLGELSDEELNMLTKDKS